MMTWNMFLCQKDRQHSKNYEDMLKKENQIEGFLLGLKWTFLSFRMNVRTDDENNAINQYELIKILQKKHKPLVEAQLHHLITEKAAFVCN